MKTRSVWRLLVLLASLSWTSANAQKLTEQFIPIGKSPGLSGKVTSIATIDTVDTKQKTVTCTDASGTFTVAVDKTTKIWLDRSKQQLSNIPGSLGNCGKGQVVEVKFRNNERRPGVAADWIKIEVRSP